jgi:phospholipid/cholesterol/gamma-HCH transport system ATP-binding protein
MPGEGGRRGIPWGRRAAQTPADEEAHQTNTSGAVHEPAVEPGPAPDAEPGPAAAPEPTFDRVSEHDAAVAAEHPHRSYDSIDHIPGREPGGEPEFAPLQDGGEVDEAGFARTAPPGEAPADKSTTEMRVERERDRPGGEDEFAYHSGTVRPTEEPDAIEFIDVHKSFGRNHVLRGLNMGLPENKISMILGPSGTGKSVCIKHIVGLLYPDQGDVIVHGQSIPALPDVELFELRKKFGVLFQDGALFGSMNLYDNVAFPLRQHTEKGDEEIAEIVNRRLNEVGLGNANEKMPNELSGGMRKRAGFARALVMEPDIVLFDEPDSGLDPVRTALLCELIKEVHAENGGCYVVITHDIMSARRVAEHISVLWKGRIVETGPAQELFASENPFVQQFLSGRSAGPLGME